MLRKLKHHEAKLLRKVDFLEYPKEKNVVEIKAVAKYGLKNREEYLQYHQVSCEIKRLARKLATLQPTDSFRIDQEKLLVDKLFHMGILSDRNTVSQVLNVRAESFCRRRLNVILCRLNMADTIKDANKFIQHGHVRVGVETANDPAMLITRSNEDFVTWVDSSAIKRHVMKYNNKLDDYDLL
ncbi:U3 small nucleolar ribonucleoprotein imp3 [Dimargaris cristalligena]|uniref:U3 small nucleolar ribonucleoprotein protein IMP3 n=1 Tax=Dimargaris cristalligena TaxID=215637 RepID=A0A4P9ZL80_9FUNG|nr:U3 small nucleolar ribonucleoprotein imp3 [Dimargaris cristalligena]RKP34044.1 hypothetical protein BJ085DRAFT_19238 [Dimargaris cristalligena]|eukprot:RKP34044.1 hypothetical protein BJ085DRAFT_19238 [Dimargaris cristalligena]